MPAAGGESVVEVRRNRWLLGSLGIVAAGFAVVYSRRLAQDQSVMLWFAVVLLALIAVVHLVGFVDSRLPLLVADEHGVRIRLGRSWRGVPWGSLRRLEHTPREGLWRDGHLVLVPYDEGSVLSGLDLRGRRRVWLSRRLYDAPLAVPLGLSTTITGAAADLSERLAALAGDETSAGIGPVVTSDLGPDLPVEVSAGSDADEGVRLRTETSGNDADRDGSAEDRYVTGSDGGGVDVAVTSVAAYGSTAGVLTERIVEPDLEPDETPGLDEVTGSLGPAGFEELPPSSATPEPARAVRPARRAGVTMGALPDRVSRQKTAVDASARRRATTLDLPHFAPEPAAHPVVGPTLARARRQRSLSVDELAFRTRIRPHVIEAVEVDDFGPCGGDFYARGHLRTLARVLGEDVVPLLALYDEHYAHAPISPRRVFEAELATGNNGLIRGTKSGPNWSVLIAALMAVVLAWGIARLVFNDEAPDPSRLGTNPSGTGPADSRREVPVVVRAAGGAAQVVIRGANGAIALESDLAFGASRAVTAVPPVRIESSDGSVEVVIDGEDQGPLGETGRPAVNTY
jgi:cytoskeleton protein RodZ